MIVHFVLALLLQAAPMAPQPDLTEIVRKMYERVDRDAARQVKGATWTKNKTEEDISDPKRPRAEHREVYRVWSDGTRMMQQKMLRDGKRPNEAEKPLSFFLDRTFLDRFEFSLSAIPRVKCGERVCWYLAFMPRQGQAGTFEGLEQRFLAGASGTMQVDAGHYGIVRVEIPATRKPLYESFLMTVYWFQVFITQSEIDGTMVTTGIDMSLAVSSIFSDPKTKRWLYTHTDIKLPEQLPPAQ